jgi:FtsH-binding integral membrane protein
MSQYPPPFPSPGYQGVNMRERVAGYPGERSSVVAFFNVVYAWMAAGLALTGVVAWWVSTRQDVMVQVFRPPVLIGLIVVELALVWTISAAVNKLSAGAATALFMLYSAINGLTLSIIFIAYTRASIGSTFLVTAGTFGAMSLFGMVTKRDLTRLGSILFMALIGLVIASLVNIFLRSPAFYWILTYAGVLIFVGLTAYDTQKLKHIAEQTASDPRMAARYAVNGALVLYLDFINLFLLLLRILGDRRNN